MGTVGEDSRARACGIQHQHHGAAGWRLYDRAAFGKGLYQQGRRRHPGAVHSRRGRRVFPQGIPNLEDPAIFYSGGLYHIVVNSWSTRKAYHLTSEDGKSNWINRGLAYDPTKDFVRYTDGTVNHWEKLERPGVLIENGHVTAVTLAVLGYAQGIMQKGNDNHGSKIIVIPFDGAALDRDLPNAAGTQSHAAASPSRPLPRPPGRPP